MDINSEMPAAQDFQAWIYEEVIPSIRATGAYTVNRSAQQASSEDWNQERLDGIHL